MERTYKLVMFFIKHFLKGAKVKKTSKKQTFKFTCPPLCHFSIFFRFIRLILFCIYSVLK